MRLPQLYLYLVVAATVEGAKAHPLVSPFLSSRTASRRATHEGSDSSTSAVSKPSAARSLRATRTSDLTALPKRRKRHLYGASKERGSWRKLLASYNDQEEVHATTSSTSKIILDSSGDRELQSTTNAALQKCRESIPIEESVGEPFGTICQCLPDFVQKTYTLKCRDSNCAYCNNDETVCTAYSYGVVFDVNGDDIEYFEQDIYTTGREGSILYSEKDESCSVSIGDVECAQCSMQDCSDGYYGVVVSCGNVEEGASFNSCDETFSSQGIFEAFNKDEFDKCYGNLDVCRMARATVDERFDCFCENDPDTVDVSLLKCDDNCERCSNGLGFCAEEKYEQSFENARFAGSKRTVQYTSGRSEIVEYEESNCEPAAGCQECTVMVDGVPCESCTIQTCANGTKAPLVQCSNIDPGLSVAADFCTAQSLAGSVLEFFDARFTGDCVSKKDVACREAKKQYELHDLKFLCDCVDQDDGSLELRCKASCGELCNGEETVCVRESFRQDFLDVGTSSYFRKDIKYTLGRNETLTYVEFIDGICSMKIDGVGCSSCVMNTCPGNSQVERAPLIDCSNLEGGSSLDLCQPDTWVETGIFERFSIEQFQECLDHTPANGVCETNVLITEMPYQTTGTTLMIPYDNADTCGSAQSFAPGLWYTVVGAGKGIEASVCEPEADFNVHISVFTGLNCKNKTCAAASNDACKIDWMANEDTMYFIRVHGTGGQIGNFELSVREINYGSVECEVSKTFFENNPDLETSCRECEAPNADGQVHLRCDVGCNTCDESGSICANQTVTTNFTQAGHIAFRRQHYRYFSGRDEILQITKFNCSDPDTCQACEVRIDDDKCVSCEIIDCTSAEASQGLLVTCGNSTINTCGATESNDGGVLRPLIDSTYNKCFSRDATVACLDYKAFEQDVKGGIVCDCERAGEAEDVRLVCRRQTCLHCNEDRTTCGYEAFGVVFDGKHGSLSSRFEGFQYIQGRNDLVAHHVSNNVAQADGNCTMTVSDVQCDTCIKSQCGDVEEEQLGLFNGITFDCQNVPGGMFYDGCTPIGLPGTFEFINSPAFRDCVPVVSPQKACETLSLSTMVSRSRQQNTCNCNLTETGFYELVCTDDEGCLYCSDDSSTTCADYTQHRVEINHFGSSVARIESYQWESARTELLVIRESESGCQVTVDGELCSFCARKKCLDDTRGFSINCTNVVANATFHCGKGHEIFTPISDSAVYTCPGDTLAPLPSPTFNPEVVGNIMPHINLVVDELKSDAFGQLCTIALIATGTSLAWMLL